MSPNSQKNSFVGVSFFNKVATLLKSRARRRWGFFCEFCENFMKNFLVENLQATTASTFPILCLSNRQFPS